MGHKRRSRPSRHQLRPLQRMERRPRPQGVPARVRGSQKTRLGLGYEEHQQPQCAHSEEKLPRSGGVLSEMSTARRISSASEARHL